MYGVIEYTIIQVLEYPCRLIDVSVKGEPGSTFVVAKFGNYDSGNFLFSIIRNAPEYDTLCRVMRANKRLTIKRYVLKLHEGAYHKYTWDDVDRNICTNAHVGEVQRNDEGLPLVYSQIVIFADLNGSSYPNIEDRLYKEYISISSPDVNKTLQFNSREQYYAKLNEKNRQKELEEEEWMAAKYDAYEEHKYDNMDLSFEEQVMNALENGCGEYFGY